MQVMQYYAVVNACSILVDVRKFHYLLWSDNGEVRMLLL